MCNMIDLLHTVDTTVVDGTKYMNSNGLFVPRVTEILSAMIHSDSLMYWANSIGLKGIRYKDALNKASSIGTKSHFKIECFLKDKLEDKTDIPFLGFMMWYNSLIENGNTITLIESEKELVCDWFGGTCDALLDINGKVYLVDFKTSNHVTEKYFLQLAAYRYMLELIGYTIDGFIVLQLEKNEVGFNEYLLLDNVEEHNTFMKNCLTTFLSLVYSYYSLHGVRNQFKSMF